MPRSMAAKWCEGTSDLRKLAGALAGALVGVALEAVVVGDGEWVGSSTRSQSSRVKSDYAVSGNLPHRLTSGNLPGRVFNSRSESCHVQVYSIFEQRS